MFTDDLDAAWSQVEPWAETWGPTTRLVACRWASPPRIDELIAGVVRTFAGVALADWPQWYGTSLSADVGGSAFERNLTLRAELHDICRQHVRVATPWLRRAAERCLRGEPPFDASVSREFQAAQLALAVGPEKLLIVLCAGSTKNELTNAENVEEGSATAESGTAESGAAALVAAGEWLQRVTGAAVVLLMPIAWRGQPGLQRLGPGEHVVTFQPTKSGSATNDSSRLDQSGQLAGTNEPSATKDLSGLTDLSGSGGLSGSSGMSVSVSPLPGRPHPGSAAEQLLFQRIQADTELSPLLEFNRSVEVSLGQKFRVDIVCRARRVAVEVDGDDHRASAGKYSADCERDYRLMKDGYLVLRLPNELVIRDPNLALERMRDLLRYREGHHH